MAQDLRGQRQPGSRLDEPCPCGAPQGMERLAVTGRVVDAGPARRRRMRVGPVEFPSFTSGALSRMNTSGASQPGRPCKIHSATALPAGAGSGSTSGLDVLAWTSRISSRCQSISSSRSATMSTAPQPGRDRQRDHRVVPLPAGGPGLDPFKETAGFLTGKARQRRTPAAARHARAAGRRRGRRCGGVEEGEEPLERPHHVADARRPPGCHLGHEPPDVVHGDRTGRAPAGPVEVGQEMPDLARERCSWRSVPRRCSSSRSSTAFRLISLMTSLAWSFAACSTPGLRDRQTRTLAASTAKITKSRMVPRASIRNYLFASWGSISALDGNAPIDQEAREFPRHEPSKGYVHGLLPACSGSCPASGLT